MHIHILYIHALQNLRRKRGPHERRGIITPARGAQTITRGNSPRVSDGSGGGGGSGGGCRVAYLGTSPPSATARLPLAGGDTRSPAGTCTYREVTAVFPDSRHAGNRD